jgi:LPS-assembly protein
MGGQRVVARGGGSRRRQAVACANALMVVLAGGAQAQDQPAVQLLDSLALIRADNMRYDPQNEVVSAEGHVEIDYRGEHLSADHLAYDQKADRVTADGHVTIIDKTGNVFFTDHAELTDQMREGVIEKVGILFGKNARIAANSAVRHKDTATVFTKAVYSPCNLCKSDPKKAPLWQLKARRATHDKADKEVYYRDMQLELFGVPVFYLPYFSHPDPTVKRKSGFLSPSFGTSSYYGGFLTLPYYWVINDSMDATLTPTFEEHDGVHFRGEFRQRLRNGQYTVDGSVVRTDELNDLNQKTGKTDTRGHLFADGQFTIDPVWSMGAQIQATTDDTYLRRYKISNLDRLENHAYLQGIDGRTYFTADAYAFKDLRLGGLPGQTPLVLPQIEGNYAFVPGAVGGLVNLKGSFLSLSRSRGTDVRRFTGSLDWQRTFTLSNGQVITGFASVRSDLYFIHDFDAASTIGTTATIASVTGTTSGNNTTRGRVLPEAGLEWHWPFVKQYSNFQHIIEPIVQFIYAPKGGNTPVIPNEDSQSFEFDESNLFSRDRFTGYDRWEDGPRLNYGLRTAAFWGTDSSAEILIGQSHRFLDRSPFGAGTGLEEKGSDIVGAVIFRPRSYIELSHRFRLDNNSFDYQRNESSVSLYFWRVTANATYTSITGNDKTLLSNSLEAFSVATQFRLADHWTLSAATQRDLTNDRTISRQIGIGYLNECISFNVLYRQDYTSDRDITPSSSVVFQIRLVNLG